MLISLKISSDQYRTGVLEITRIWPKVNGEIHSCVHSHIARFVLGKN